MSDPDSSPHLDHATALWLTGAVGRGHVARIVAEKRAGIPAHRLVESLRNALPSQFVLAAFEQAAVREKTAEKFPPEWELLATPKGLEQSTEWAIARYKARRLAERVGPAATVVDIGCGIGGDLLGLIEAGFRSVIGYERDPATAIFAQANAEFLSRLLPQDRAEQTIAIESCAIAPDALPADAVWHIDPDRRPGGHRAVEWQWLEPGPQFLRELLHGNPTGLMKGAPAAPELPGELAGVPQTREWIGARRECRQQTIWFGAACDAPGMHRATLVQTETDDWRTPPRSESFTGRPGLRAATCADWKAYLHEPVAVVLAAELDGALAADMQLAQRQPGLPYFTSDAPCASGLVASFAIDAVLPWRKDRVKAMLRERNIGRLEIKKRGVELDPATIRKELRLQGDEQATLFLTRLGEQRIAILTRRVEH